MPNPIHYTGRYIWQGTDGSPVTTYHIDTDRRDIDISSEIAMLVPEATPFMTILMRARKLPVNSTEFIWYDDGAPNWYTQIDNVSNYTASDTILKVKDAAFLRPKDLLKNTSTGEMLYVQEVDKENNEITVRRGAGYDSNTSTGTQATDIGHEDFIMRVGNAMEEMSSAPESYATQPEKYFNYVQTIRTPFEGSFDSENERKTAGGNERLRLRRQKLIEHRIDLEKTAIWGERKEDVAHRTKFTGGIMQFIKSNVYDVKSVPSNSSGELNEAIFEDICEMAFKYNSRDGAPKLLITSRKVGSIINQWAAGKIETTSGEETYGLRLKRYVSFHGDLIIIPSRLFEHDYEGVGLILDMENVYFRPFAGQDSTLRTNIQLPDVDGWKDEYVTKFGMMVRNEATHTIITGIEK
ncbi:MAG TPA: DUF5309 family protein [Halanaerobiales bacterium]|nr:DUF5309 family protein [Halanaerobiales bacterium]